MNYFITHRTIDENEKRSKKNEENLFQPCNHHCQLFKLKIFTEINIIFSCNYNSIYL